MEWEEKIISVKISSPPHLTGTQTGPHPHHFYAPLIMVTWPGGYAIPGCKYPFKLFVHLITVFHI